ncbi:hypothetical protein ACWDBW_01380 [Streptomyces sp. NPDC001107]
MNSTQTVHLKRVVSRVAVGAALGLALAAGTATGAFALAMTPAAHVTTKATSAQPSPDGDTANCVAIWFQVCLTQG